MKDQTPDINIPGYETMSQILSQSIYNSRQVQEFAANQGSCVRLLFPKAYEQFSDLLSQSVADQIKCSKVDWFGDKSAKIEVARLGNLFFVTIEPPHITEKEKNTPVTPSESDNLWVAVGLKPVEGFRVFDHRERKYRGKLRHFCVVTAVKAGIESGKIKLEDFADNEKTLSLLRREGIIDECLPNPPLGVTRR